MLNSRERWIHHYNFGVKSVPEDAPSFSLIECLKAIKAKVDRYECAKLIHKKKACVRLARLEISEDESMAALLFHYSDSNISDPAFSDLVSGALRHEPKLTGEGIAISAHALIYFSRDPAKPFENLLLLEDAPGIGKSKIVPFLNQFLKELMTRSYKSVSDGKETPCLPVVFMDHHASQTLKADLQRGKLSFMELNRNVTITGFDEDPYLVKATQSIKIKLNRPEADPNSVDFINKD